MSAVLEQTKQLYRKALCLEIVILALAALIVVILSDNRIAFSSLLGQIAGFLPHCVFVFFVFFFNRSKIQPKMTTFYRGEGLKWLCSIILMSMAFIGYKEMHYLAFFIGYLLALGANSLLPIVLKLNGN
ncbi:hypothetical protein RO21_10480 [[Actinobacillus] muris]|uniref:F0F1 ATP synthase subunit I n=1 Tax=Muribacter muris TaxID=67855 RepID=A0A0J5P4Q5_9PAST|nr:ATP synthase subunit I [Muribacter muris]KMK50675.1 hypothetical protein RO21_10480 [[Actinobacillus] muris] [Muribacter muris]